MAAQQNFRTAFNGFNREDVVHYIEYLNSKHTAEVNQLKSELDFLRNKDNANAPEITAEPEDLSARCAALEEELEALRAEKNELDSQLSEAMDAGIEIEKQLNAALAEKDELAAKLESALNQQKDVESRSAQELEAYRRAERAERMAQERAQQMYRQANGVIADATVKVNEAAVQIGELSESVLAQLNQLQEAVAGSNAALKDAAAVMFSIRPETEE